MVSTLTGHAHTLIGFPACLDNLTDAADFDTYGGRQGWLHALSFLYASQRNISLTAKKELLA